MFADGLKNHHSEPKFSALLQFCKWLKTMGVRLKHVAVPIGALLIAGMLGAAPVLAQNAAARAGQGAKGTPPTPETILGPAMLRPGTADLACGTGPAGLAQWGIQRIEQSLSLAGTPLAKFNDLKDASEKAVRFLQESCPTSDPATPTGRLGAMEQRLEAMLEAVRTVKPPLDDFYASLTDEQKARLNVLDTGPSGSPTKSAARNATGSRYAMNQVPREQPVQAAASEPPAPHGGHHRHHHWGFRIRIPIPFL
jgi:hypothetical protein